MKLTRIAEENRAAFEPLASGMSIADYDIAIGAIEDDKPVAIAVFDIMNDVLMLDYLYVLKEYRRRGIAGEMLTEFIKVMKPLEPSAIHTNFPETSEDLVGFFEKMDFSMFRDGSAFSVKLSDLKKSKALDKIVSVKKVNEVVTLPELTEGRKDQIKNYMIEAKLDPETIDNHDLSDELSIITLDDETRIPGAIALCKVSGNVITIDYIGTFSHELNHLTDLFRALFERVNKLDMEDMEVDFVVMDEKMKDFAKKLVGDKNVLEDKGRIFSAMLMLQ